MPIAKRPPGRPIKRGEEWRPVQVVLYRSGLDFLTRVEAGVRLAQATNIQRSEIIRAILDGVEASGLDLTHCANEAAIRELVAASLKSAKPKKRAEPRKGAS